MSIFGDIVNKIFHRAKPEEQAPAVAPEPVPAQTAAAAPAGAPAALSDVGRRSRDNWPARAARR